MGRRKKSALKAAATDVVDSGVAKQKNHSKIKQQFTSFLGLDSNEIARLKQTPEENGRTDVITTLEDTPVHLSTLGCTKRIPEVIVFHDPSKAAKKNQSSQDSEEQRALPVASDSHLLSLNDARFDVRKFGIKGMQTEDKQAATIALLVKMGAKPPKKAYLNYKLLQENVRLKKEEKVTKLQDGTATGEDKASKTKKSNQLGKKAKKRDIGFIDGQIGCYKNGVQIVSKEDIRIHDKKRLRK